MESLANVMIYLYKGKLPWFQRLNARLSRRQRYDIITKLKLGTSVDEITNGIPEELKKFYSYSREGINFDQRPDYSYLKSLIHTLIY